MEGNRMKRLLTLAAALTLSAWAQQWRTGMLVLVMAFVSPITWAQQPHSVTLVWADTRNPAVGTTYTVYRAPGLCSGSPVYAKLATALPGKTYEDVTVTPGNYCYAVTATVQGMESPHSNSAMAPVPAFAPAELSVTVK
jgi:hypothetical protein